MLCAAVCPGLGLPQPAVHASGLLARFRPFTIANRSKAGSGHLNPAPQVNLAEAEERANDKLSGWRLRVALAEGGAAVMRTDPKLISPEVLEAAVSCISGLLADDSYAARLAGGRLVQVWAGQAG